ncbi:hypothetical protein F5Y18DRAFT_383609 [Xylariaceae sp. FL1019]|nr:hypothetical protein F5Y18DRAFT_383609 [Xylariaceae sp. FL1019]
MKMAPKLKAVDTKSWWQDWPWSSDNIDIRVPAADYEENAEIRDAAARAFRPRIPHNHAEEFGRWYNDGQGISFGTEKATEPLYIIGVMRLVSYLKTEQVYQGMRTEPERVFRALRPSNSNGSDRTILKEVQRKSRLEDCEAFLYVSEIIVKPDYPHPNHLIELLDYAVDIATELKIPVIFSKTVWQWLVGNTTRPLYQSDAPSNKAKSLVKYIFDRFGRS